MALHLEKGSQAEKLAAEWLSSKGYELVETNYRHRHAEIDLIMKHNGLLIFIEVKYRSGNGYGFPEEFVDYRKRQLIVRAADHYIHAVDWHKDIRFDIVAVHQDKYRNMTFRHFEDAFY